jgi:hypothetical protein
MAHSIAAHTTASWRRASAVSADMLILPLQTQPGSVLGKQPTTPLSLLAQQAIVNLVEGNTSLTHGGV